MSGSETREPHLRSSPNNSSASTMMPVSDSSSISQTDAGNHQLPSHPEPGQQTQTASEKEVHEQADIADTSMAPTGKQPFKVKLKNLFSPNGKLRPFRLLKQDVRNIRSRYFSDWSCFNQLIFASAVYVFFTNILPGITFASDLYVLTGKTWGTIEVVFSTGLCGLIFSLTIFGIGRKYLFFMSRFIQMMAWSLIHAGWMHYLLAIFNAHDWTMQYVTNFSADIFSLLNSVIYFHKAIQELQRTHEAVPFDSFLYAIIGAIGTFLMAVTLSTANSWKPLFHRYFRMGLAEYAAAISIIFFIGVPHIGELANLQQERLAVSTSFRPSSPDRTVFFVKFWELPIAWIFISMIPGAIITILFYFDHEISSIICTLDRYGTKKPGGFAWDIVLLGTTTAICGILGIPPANGLLPQAPLHSESLLHTVKVEAVTVLTENGEERIEIRERQEVFEQRWSSFLQSAGILLFLSPPFQHVLGLTPTSVLAGLFIFMGEQSLAVNPILFRFFWMLTPASELPPLPRGVKNYWGIHGYTLLQIVMTGIIFYVTLTVAAPAFPVIIIALMPVRLLVMNRIWGRETLRFVDGWACREGGPEEDEDRMKGVRGEGGERKVGVVDRKEEKKREADMV
ncbi:HCO3- transporter family protein [Rutstroemia sp. NJR-2017a BBW]|nr:HCO3- transporter family protein [Rutstroemia sp. NJR-2017a BBW]